MGLDPKRLRALERLCTARPGFVSILDLARRVRQTRRILEEECALEMHAGRMTREQFERLAGKFDAIWAPW